MDNRQKEINNLKDYKYGFSTDFENIKKDFDQKFRELVKNRIIITHQKLIEQDIRKDFNQELKQLIKKRNVYSL